MHSFEEGSFTPNIINHGITPGNAQASLGGEYSRLNTFTHCEGYFTPSHDINNGGGGSGTATLQLTGLPFNKQTSSFESTAWGTWSYFTRFGSTEGIPTHYGHFSRRFDGFVTDRLDLIKSDGTYLIGDDIPSATVPAFFRFEFTIVTDD